MFQKQLDALLNRKKHEAFMPVFKDLASETPMHPWERCKSKRQDIRNMVIRHTDKHVLATIQVSSERLCKLIIRILLILEAEGLGCFNLRR
jgi:hypothetical protein